MSHGSNLTRAWLAFLFAFFAATASAQEASTPAEAVVVEGVGAEEVQEGPSPEELSIQAFRAVTGIDYSAWEVLAAEVEAQLASSQRAVNFNNARADVLPWREAFDKARNTNAARVATVESQIAALGAAVEGEDPIIASRRAVLAQQASELNVPSRLAAEGYIRADGIIREIDQILRTSQASQLLSRQTSLLDASLWPQVGASIKNISTSLTSELSATVARSERWERVSDRLLLVAVGLAAGLLSLVFSPRVATMLRERGTLRYPNATSSISFIASIGRLIAQVTGVWLIAYSLQASGLFGVRMNTIINALPAAGAMLFASRWVGSRFFTTSRKNPSPFDFSLEQKARGRRLMTELGAVLALGTVLGAVMDVAYTSPSVRNAVSVPIALFVAFTLYRLGRFLSSSTQGRNTETETNTLRYGLLWSVGILLSALGVVGPILSVAGYARAAEWMLFPASQTLFIAAALITIQWFAFDIYALLARSAQAAQDSLLPVLVGIVLLLLAIPALALVWGARMEDLVEVGGRIARGVSFGDVTLSPAAIIMGLVIFAICYFATRLVQSMLQNSVLPKTRLDRGGQAAVVSVVGYIGIVLAALFGITSAGLNLSSFAVVAGALSVGIGFGLQDIVKNFVSGIILVIGRPVSQGDWIEVAGFSGYVREISIRSTRIETFDRSDVIIPNADLVSGRVVNWTRGNSVGRITVAVTAAYGSDPERVMAIINEAVEAQPLVLLSPPPSVSLTSFSPDTMNFEAKALVRDINSGGGVRAAINLELAKRFAEEGIQSRNGLVLLPPKEPETHEVSA